ncbi:MAG: DUF748 domain-containing protein, partial [Deltaproteobacteria bacterium]|nr:DUF748 domain-containing protein [Deltaproteobacteria bacterium]
MRRWLLVGAVLLLAAAGALAYGLTRLDRYLADQRDALQAQASALLGRAVTFDALDVTLRGGVGASLTNLAIADDPRFGSGPFLTAAHAAVRLELLPALRGEYRIRRIVVDQPTVNLIRDADGWNALSIALLHRAADGAPTAAPGAPAAERVDTRLPAIGAVVVAAMTIDDGQVHIVDRTRQPPVELAVTQLRLRGHELALGAPIQFELAAAVLGASAPNLTVTGMLEPGEPPRADVHAEWQPLPLNALTPLLTAWVGPPAASLALGGTAGGTLRIAGAVDRTTLPAIDGSVTLGDVSLASAALPARIGQLSGVLRVTPQGVALENATAALGGAPLRLACQAAPPADPLVHCRLEAAEITAAQLGVDGRPGDALRARQADAELRPRDAAPVLRATARVAEGQIHGAPFR